jgi:hypothetical protein
MTEWFHVGQKVVCIVGGQHNPSFHLPEDVLPVQGRVYTVREIGRWNPEYPDHVTIRLIELVNRPIVRVGQGNPFIQVRAELFFYAEDFRPLREKKTDIEVFRRLLNTVPGQREAVDG